MQLLFLWRLRDLEQGTDGALSPAEVASLVAGFKDSLDCLAAYDTDSAILQTVFKARADLYMVFAAEKLQASICFVVTQ